MTEQEQLGDKTENGQLESSATRDPTVCSTGAHFSPDRLYRYALWREWAGGSRPLVVIGLNPSTADETVDDPTIRRCIGFAKREGCGSLTMLNLFAFRATAPAVMKAQSDPVGPDNDRVLRVYTTSTEGYRPLVVAAWGIHGAHRDRATTVKLLTPRLRCFGVTKDGHPRHPLYLRGDAPLVPYPLPERAPVLASDRSRSTPNEEKP